MRRQLLMAPVLLALCATGTATGSEGPDSNLEFLHKQILPATGDSQWMSVPWVSATNLWAARQKAAEEGKPLFLWYMGGEPLGPC